MNSIIETINDALSFAERHHLDSEQLLELVFAARDTSAPWSSVSYEPKGEPLPDPPEDYHALSVEIVKNFWQRQPVGYVATVQEIYAACDRYFPPHGKALSHWLMNADEASAQCIGERNGSNLYAKVSKTI